jgi:2-polyprenyl-6-methoxyphenol hydroxylase-like FAD-dependent oxidoreductase
VHTFSRDLLEATLRRRVAALDAVVVRDGAPVEQLHADAAGKGVDGVVLHTGDSAEVLTADLVVDASGRFSALPDWLEKLGYPRPETTVVDAKLAYATRAFTGPELTFLGAQRSNSAPRSPRGMYVARVEGGRWLVTLFGADGDHPPIQEDGWVEFARSLRNEAVDAVLAEATPLSEIHRFSRTENRRHEYAKMSRWPDRLIALGDSFCAFNPVYGQGMTVSVLEAAALGKELERRAGGSLDGVAAPFRRQVAKIARLPWLMSVSEDLIWQHHRQGRKLPLGLRLANWYKQRLLYLITTDLPTYQAFLTVYNMLKPPTALGGPRIAAKVIFRAKSPKGSAA